MCIYAELIFFFCFTSNDSAPYGVRERTEKIDTKARRPIKQEWNETPPHYPSKSLYCLSNLYVDLLRFAGKHLRIGGRLICWLPVYK